MGFLTFFWKHFGQDKYKDGKSQAMLLGFVMFTVLSGKLGKFKVLMARAIIQIITTLVIMLCGTNVAVIMVANFVRSFGMALMSGGVYPLVADAVDYGEWKNGVRQDGLTNSAVFKSNFFH